MYSESKNIGRQIGNYLLIEKIGDGPFSTVYQGEHRNLQKGIIRAIKIVHRICQGLCGIPSGQSHLIVGTGSTSCVTTS